MSRVDVDLLYREVQYFRQIWLWILLLSISLITLWGMVQQLFLGANSYRDYLWLWLSLRLLQNELDDGNS